MKHSLVVFIKKCVPLVVIAAVAYFFASALSKNWSNLESISLRPNLYSVTGVLLFAGAVTISGLLWGGLLKDLTGKSVSSRDAMRIHSASWLLKYVPGQAGSILNKLAWGTKNGFSKKSITNSFIYENVLMVLAGALLSVPVIFVFKERLHEDLSVLLPLLVIIPMVIVVQKPVFHWLLNTAFSILKRKPFTESDFLSTGNLFKFLSLYLLPRLMNGVGFIFIAASIITIEPGMYMGLSATYILAGIVGILAIFVPSGLGVREAVITLFLSQYFGTEQAIVLALLARFYATLADILVFAVYFVLNKGKLKQL